MIIFTLITACTDAEKSDSERDIRVDTGTTFEPSWEPSDEPEDTGNTDDTGEQDSGDTGPEIILLEEGDWRLSNPTLLADPCGVAEFQEVSEFVPTNIGVDDSQAESFVMLPDGLMCERNESELRCDTFYFEEETSAIGLAATLDIKNEITGNIFSSTEMELIFDVTIQSCDGPGCFFIETALSFPCLLQQSSIANHL